MPAIRSKVKSQTREKKGSELIYFSRFVLVLNNVNLQTAGMPFGSGQDADKRVYIVKDQVKAE